MKAFYIFRFKPLSGPVLLTSVWQGDVITFLGPAFTLPQLLSAMFHAPSELCVSVQRDSIAFFESVVTNQTDLSDLK
jgi:hypothetical protein